MSTSVLRQLEADLGDLLARQETARDAADYSRYANDPVGFIRDVLGGSPWPRQVEVAESVRDEAQTSVRSCHAAGKDWLAARLSLWWVYARNGLVILTGPTAPQVEEILMRREVAGAFQSGKLPGELHVRALRPGDSPQAGILARTASGTHGMTGFHNARVLFVITESQDPEIDHAWDAAFACTTGAEDRILTLGNPTEPDGRFFRAHLPGSGWNAIRIAAADIPNVAEGRTVVPGLLTAEGVARFIREYGEGSPVVTSRVHAEFPSEATDALVSREWWDRATDLHRTGALLVPEARIVLGCDPARLGPDRTVLAIRQGLHVREFIEWRRADTMQSAERVRVEVRRLLREVGPVAGVHVDEVGLGGGVLDRLAETLPAITWTEYRTDTLLPEIVTHRVQAHGFSAARQTGVPDRFRNRRAQAFWTLRKLMEEGRIALPSDDGLREELLATRVRFGADGKTEIEGKDALKDRLGRSPDYADALVISLAPTLERSDTRRLRWR